MNISTQTSFIPNDQAPQLVPISTENGPIPSVVQLPGQASVQEALDQVDDLEIEIDEDYENIDNNQATTFSRTEQSTKPADRIA